MSMNISECMTCPRESQLAFDIFERFAAAISARETKNERTTEGKKRRRPFPSRAVTFGREEQCRDVSTRDTPHAFHLLEREGRKRGNRISEKGKASRGMQVACASRAAPTRMR